MARLDLCDRGTAQTAPGQAITYIGGDDMAEGTCTAGDWCNSPIRNKTLRLCGACYANVRKYGTVMRVPRKRIDPSVRFWAKVNKDGPVCDFAPHLGPCWCWMAGLDSRGYGKFGLTRSVIIGAHRFAYLDCVGPIPKGLHLDHLCRNIICVRPAHLEPVTQKVNAERGLKAMQTHCIHGHEFTPENTYIKANGCRLCRQCGADNKRRRRQDAW